MTGIFLRLLNMSIAASWLVLAVMVLRLFFKNAPKWISCLLWGIVALRLVMPFSVHSLFSLIPSGQVIPQDIATSQTPAIHSGIPQLNSVVNPMVTQQLIRGEDMRSGILQTVAVVWAAGAVLMLLYSVVSYLMLRRKVRVSVCCQKGVYICDNIASPFVLGVLFPGIYIPSGLEEAQLQHVLAHENAHIKRLDHWWKPLGYLLLSVYWFNPLLWLAYIFLCRDIERACDEKVIAGMDNAGKKSYSEALLACSVHRRTVMACPVAFGEISVKARIKGIVRYKKPAVWILMIAILACTLTAACFLTDPEPCDHEYHGEITVSATCTSQGMQTLTCSLCEHSYSVPVELLAHSYDEGTVVTEPTCIQLGARKRTCTGCGEETTEVLPITPHTAGELTVTKEANCAEKGEVTSVCTLCAAVFVAQKPEKNDIHAMQRTVLKASTCTVEGSALNTCTRCGHEENEILPLAEHDYKTTYTKKPTCIKKGKKYQQCKICGTEKVIELSPSDKYHKWIDGGNPQHCAYCFIFGPVKQAEGAFGGTTFLCPEKFWPVISWDLGAHGGSRDVRSLLCAMKSKMEVSG